MSRTVGSSGPKTLRAIHEEGLQLIYTHGYEAMSLRDLAAKVGLRQSSLYNYMATKQDLLFDLIHNHMLQLHERIAAELSDVKGPLERLKCFIAFHLTYHIERRREVFIGSAELRSLEPENRQRIVALRRAYEDILCEILTEGQKRQIFTMGDTRISAFAILAMLTGICTWYDPDGAIGRADLIEIHMHLILQGLLNHGAEAAGQ